MFHKFGKDMILTPLFVLVSRLPGRNKPVRTVADDGTLALTKCASGIYVFKVS